MRRLTFAFVIWFCVLSSIGETACTGSSPIWTSDPDQTSLTTCLGSASNGDTINVNGGSGSWANLNISPAVTISGGHGGTTTISCTGEPCIFLHQTQPGLTRLTGFTFLTSVSTGQTVFMYVAKGDAVNASAKFRFDNNIATSAGTWWEFSVFGSDNGSHIALHATGLMDHNTLTNFATLAQVTDYGGTDDGLATQSNCWTQTSPLGQESAYLYIEDNVFITDSNGQVPVKNQADSNQCGRFVSRFNTYSGNPHSTFEIHSVQGENRATHRWEIYGNRIDGASGSVDFFVRSGTGVIWGNRTSEGSGTIDGLKLNNIRSQNAPVPFGGCDGQDTNSTNVDVHAPNPANGNNIDGYMCLDQIGKGYDSVQWVPPTHGGSAPHTPVAMPAYFWDNLSGTDSLHATNPLNTHLDNLIDGGYPSLVKDWSGGNGNISFQVLQNRDWYNEDDVNCPNAGLNCTSGVGVGTTLPTHCTTGVGFWKTNEGSWNTSTSNPQGVQQNGADGRLYKCTSTDTWTVYYTPSTYPHSLNTGGGGGGGSSFSSNAPRLNWHVH